MIMRKNFAVVFLVLLLLQGCLSQGNSQYAIKSREASLPTDVTKIVPTHDQHPPVLHSNEWETPEPMGPSINTAGAEDSPFVTPDGNSLYFFFTPDVRIPPEKQLLDGATGIYVSKKTKGVWGPAQRIVLQDQGKLALDGCEFVQGKTMWFCSAREGFSGVNMFTAEFKEGKWQDWRYVGDELMGYGLGEMHISPDGSELYFHSQRAGGKGQLDIWVSEKQGGRWGTPQNIEVVNTAENEGWPFVSYDGAELWFTRFYMGSPALFRSKNINGTWSAPELVVSSFAGEPTLDIEGNLYFVHHFYKDDKMIEADIYFARRK